MMSRTYHHGMKAKERKFGTRWWTGGWLPYEPKATTPKVKRHHDHWHWMREPNWWIHEMMNQPFRSRDNQITRQALQLVDIEDFELLTHPKRPYIYYW